MGATHLFNYGHFCTVNPIYANRQIVIPITKDSGFYDAMMITLQYFTLEL